MSSSTAVLALTKNVDGDNARTALSTDESANMDIIDALFHSTTGHDHTGTGTKGTKVPYAGVSAVAWTSFTPTLTQSGAVVKTVNNAAYAVVGKMAFLQIILTITDASLAVATNTIMIGDIPAAIAPSVTGSLAVVGTAAYLDNGTGYYHMAAVANAATTLAFYRDGDAALFGAGITLANSDSIALSAVYEIA